jgi:hypothetical protein
MACTNSETLSRAEQAEQESQLTRKKPCRLSPPVFDKEKVLNMLIRAGDIDASDTPEQQSQQVINYINQKQQALVNKCRK